MDRVSGANAPTWLVHVLNRSLCDCSMAGSVDVEDRRGLLAVNVALPDCETGERPIVPSAASSHATAAW